MARYEDVYQFVADKGYRSEEEIIAQFKDIQAELIKIDLEYLCDKGKIRKIMFKNDRDIGNLYYRP